MESIMPSADWIVRFARNRFFFSKFRYAEAAHIS